MWNGRSVKWKEWRRKGNEEGKKEEGRKKETVHNSACSTFVRLIPSQWHLVLRDTSPSLAPSPAVLAVIPLDPEFTISSLFYSMLSYILLFLITSTNLFPFFKRLMKVSHHKAFPNRNEWPVTEAFDLACFPLRGGISDALPRPLPTAWAAVSTSSPLWICHSVLRINYNSCYRQISVCSSLTLHFPLHSPDGIWVRACRTNV